MAIDPTGATALSCISKGTPIFGKGEAEGEITGEEIEIAPTARTHKLATIGITRNKRDSSIVFHYPGAKGRTSRAWLFGR